MKRRVLAFIITTLFLSACVTLAQEGKRPTLKKSAINRYNKQLEKLNRFIQKQTEELNALLGAKQEGLGISQLENKIDSLTRLRLSVPETQQEKIEKQLSQLETIQSKLDCADAAGISTQFQEKINDLKGQLKVGAQLSKSDLKLNKKLNTSLLQLGDLEHNLKGLEKAKSGLSALELNPEKLKEKWAPIETNLNQFKEQMGDYQETLEDYKGKLADWDQTLEEEITRLEVVESLKNQQKDFFDPTTQAKEAREKMQQYQSKDYVQKQIKERFSKLIEQEGSDVISKRLAAGHEKLASYKKKFDELQDLSNAPEKAPKPMQNVPIKDRFGFGGNLQMNRGEPVSMDAGLEAAYKLSGKEEFGIGAAYRIRLEKLDISNLSTDVFNIKAFYFYRFWKSFSVQANYEWNHVTTSGTSTQTENRSGNWVKSGLVGLRKEQRFFKKLSGYATIQYDLLHKAASPGPAWTFRFGFRLK